MTINELPEFTVEQINSKSPYLETVIKLAEANKKTLGFLPYSVFSQKADQGNIFVCIKANIGCVGYLMYYVSDNGNRVKLTHVCVDKDYRNQGITKKLIQELKAKNRNSKEIILSCRRDYQLNNFWTSLGFVAVDERPGKSKKGSILTEFRLDCGYPTLLTLITQKTLDKKLGVVIDANIFYDLANDNDLDEDSKASKALMADWVQSELELCLTNEIKNEIDRNTNEAERKKLKSLANNFTFIPFQLEKFQQYREQLRPIFPPKMKHSDISDLHQLARVLGSDKKISYFVTRDRDLLERCEESLYKDYNLTLIYPIDLILRLDQLVREQEYQPIRLVGTNVERKRIQTKESDSLIDQFLNFSQGEKKSDFRRKIRQLLSEPDKIECFTIGRKEEEPIGLVVYDRKKVDELVIPILRFRNTQLTSTIIRHSIFQCFATSADEERKFTRITETISDETIIQALQEDYFVNTGKSWLKMNLKIVGNSQEISSYISGLCQNSDQDCHKFLPLADRLKNQEIITNSESISEIEKILYPAKIIHDEIPTFIIPIQAWFAKDLFDKELAEETIFGAKEELALRREVVYYRSKSPSGSLRYPGRILWYISKSKSGKGFSTTVKAIRACSRLDEIIIGKPKELYKRFRRLGVYNFEQVLETANRDFNKEIMAIKFSDTELFKQPVELNDIQQIVNKRTTLRSPYQINSSSFKILYTKGMQNPRKQ